MNKFLQKKQTDQFHIKVPKNDWVGRDYMQNSGGKSFSKIVREEDLTEFLINFFQIKTVQDKENCDLKKMLTLFVNPEQIDEMISNLKGNNSNVEIETPLACLIVDKQNSLLGYKPNVPLKVLCELELSYITIPDPQKDEIVFSLLLSTAVSVESLSKYVEESQIIPSKSFSTYVRKWEETGINDNVDEFELKLFEKVLKLEFMEGFETELQYTAYNFAENSNDSMIWRISAFNTHVRIPLDFNDYPFDHHFLSFYLLSPEAFDVSEQQLVANEFNQDISLHVDQLIPPRSFRLVSRSKKLMEVANITRVDFIPESMIRFDLELARISSTFLWHTFIPSAVISIFSLIAAGFALFSRVSFLDSVLTQVIPSVLIAIAAIQLVAAQNVPINSGHTRQDNLFIVYYISLLLLYVSLQLNNTFVSPILFLSSVVLVFIVFTNFLINIYKNR